MVPDVSSGFTADPKNAHVPLLVVLDEFALVDGPDTKLAFHG